MDSGPLPALPDPGVRVKLREAMGVTIIDAAAELEVSRNTYRLWELGRRIPRPERLRAYYAQLYRWQEAVDGVR